MGKKKRNNQQGAAATDEGDAEESPQVDAPESDETKGQGELPDDLVAEIEKNAEEAKEKDIADALEGATLDEKDGVIEESPDSPNVAAAISEADSLFKRDSTPKTEASEPTPPAVAAIPPVGDELPRKLSERDHHKAMNSTVVDVALLDGLAHLWDGHFKEADACLAGPAAQRPRHALLYGEIPMIRFMSTADLADMEEAKRRLDAAKELTEKCVKNQQFMVEIMRGCVSTLINHEMVDEWALDCQLVLADINMLRGFVMLVVGGVMDKVKGGVSLRASWKEYQNLESKVMACGEVATSSLLFGLGFFQLMIGLAPGEMLFILEAIGFVADAFAGIRYLRKAYWDGGLRSPLAGQTLLLCYHAYPGPKSTELYATLKQEADAIAKDLFPKYPSAPGLLATSSFLASMDGRMEDSHRDIEQSVSLMRGMDLHATYLEATLCYSLHRLRKWDECQKECHAFFKKTPIDNSFFQERALVMYLALNCFKVMGDVEKIRALQEFLGKYVDQLSKKSVQDKYVRHMVGKGSVTSGIVSALEMLYLQNELQSLRTEDAEWWLKELQKDPAGKEGVAVPPGELCRFLLLKGSLLHQLGRDQEALDCFAASDMKCWAKMDKGDSYLIVCVCQEVANLYLINNKVNEASNFIKRASNISNYHMSIRIKPKITVLKEEIRARRQAAEAAAKAATPASQAGGQEGGLMGKMSGWFGKK